VTRIAGWAGLSVNFRARLKFCADEYIPVDKPAITAIREVAAWSGASVLLDRNGTLQVFNWQETFSRGGSAPSLRAVTETERHDALSSVNEVTVIGVTYAPPSTRDVYGNKLWPCEVTARLARVSGERIVGERVEIRNYPITPLLADSLARERLARAYLQQNASRWIGPAEGCQSMRPLENRVLSVNRSLHWNGQAYRYEIAVTAARGTVPINSTSSTSGSWW